MKLFKKILMTIIGAGGLWISVLMVIGIIDEIKWAQTYPDYGWDIWFLSTVVIITIMTLSITIIIWYDTWLKGVIERDREHTESELAKQITDLHKLPNVVNAAFVTALYDDMPRFKRIKILKKVLEDIQ